MQPLTTRTHKHAHAHSGGHGWSTGMHGMLRDPTAMKTDKVAARYSDVHHPHTLGLGIYLLVCQTLAKLGKQTPKLACNLIVTM